MVGFIGTTDIMYFKVFFVTELDRVYDIGEEYSGYLLASTSFVYLAACLLLPYTCEHASRKFLYVIAMFGFGLCNFLLGPSEILGLPNNIYIMMSALPIMGVFSVFVFIPIIPEMLERLQVDLNIAEGEDEIVDLRLNDMVNESYTLLFALSNFVAPLIGTALYTVYGIRTTCDIFALFNIGFGVILVIFNCGPNVFGEDREFKRKLAILKGEDEEDVPAATMTKGFSKKGGTFHVGGRVNKFSSVYMRPKRAYMGNSNSVYNKYSNEISARKAEISFYQKNPARISMHNKKLINSKSHYTKTANEELL